MNPSNDECCLQDKWGLATKRRVNQLEVLVSGDSPGLFCPEVTNKRILCSLNRLKTLLKKPLLSPLIRSPKVL